MLSAEALRHVFGEGGGQVVALDGVSFNLTPGQTLAIFGPNGGGQDHAPQGARRPDPPSRGGGAGGRGATCDRLDRPPIPAVRTPHGTREPAFLGFALRGACGAPRPARRARPRAPRHG